MLDQFTEGTDLVAKLKEQGLPLSLKCIEDITLKNYGRYQLRKFINELVGKRNLPADRVYLEFYYKYVVQEIIKRERDGGTFCIDDIIACAEDSLEKLFDSYLGDIIYMHEDLHNRNNVFDQVVDIIDQNNDKNRDEIIEIICERLELAEGTAAGHFGRANKELGKPIKRKKPTFQKKTKKKKSSPVLDKVKVFVDNNQNCSRKEIAQKVSEELGLAESTAYQYVSKVLKQQKESANALE